MHGRLQERPANRSNTPGAITTTRSAPPRETPDGSGSLLKDLEQFPIALPPLAEQKRIIAKVDQLMALCDELEARLRDAEKGAQRLAEAMTAAMVA
ncbi:restriction endonuclease subunit S [Archangium lansingense]|uniref:restriction endonuclease subunit S n=1 Tax=Archangium lansingense TaxID=2995310 RepID=UPI003B7AB17F